MEPQKIYLAGPDVFHEHAREIGEIKRALCRQNGLVGLFPSDTDESVGNGDPVAIFRQNCTLMMEADIGIFNLTPFRGPSADAGTLFELGYMRGLGLDPRKKRHLRGRKKLLFGYTSSTHLYPTRVKALLGDLESRGERLWDPNRHSVESFGGHRLRDNLMIAGALRDSGGSFISRTPVLKDPIGANELVVDTVGDESLARVLAADALVALRAFKDTIDKIRNMLEAKRSKQDVSGA